MLESVKTSFAYPLPVSKSLMNRALICSSFAASPLELLGESMAEDVVFLKKSLDNIGQTREFYLGEGGTSFRFFALRISRQRGNFELRAKESLLQRPLRELLDLLAQLGVNVRKEEGALLISSEGWSVPKTPIQVSSGRSSQFLSALFLSAWNLQQALRVEIPNEISSPAYFEMTERVLREIGMKILTWQEQGKTYYEVPPEQSPLLQRYIVEPDVSCMFALAVCGALFGSYETENFPIRSLQPDSVFPEIFKKFAIETFWSGPDLRVSARSERRPVDLDLGDCPDLAPVLAVLMALTPGRSSFFGAPQLRYKESDRLLAISRLLQILKVRHELGDSGVQIWGSPEGFKGVSGSLDVSRDHRMAMAAGIAIRAGAELRLEGALSVDKSFPGFWQAIGVKP